MYKEGQKLNCPQNPYTAAKFVRKIVCLMKQGKSWIDFSRRDDSLRTNQSSDVRLEATDSNVSLSSGYDWFFAETYIKLFLRLLTEVFDTDARDSVLRLGSEYGTVQLVFSYPYL